MSAAPERAATAPLSPALRAFEAQWRAQGSRAADPLTRLREQALERVLALGLPTTRDETWRYTNLRHLGLQQFVAAPAEPRTGLESAVSQSLLGATPGAVVVLLNGHPVHSTLVSAASPGIDIVALKELSQRDPALVEAHLEPVSDADAARWGMLNTALFVDGLYVKITAPVATPLVILHVLDAEGADTVAFPRVIIDCAPESRALVLEQYVGHGAHTPLSNSATHITVGSGAHVEHYRVFATAAAAEHIDSLSIVQQAHSRCRQFTVALGGGLVRTSLDARLRQPGASLDSNSLLVGHEARHVDCVNVVTHEARDTTSNQTARAIASGTSRAIFNTKVVVKPGAVHSESRQSCRGLLLSPQAEIDTRPQLEIHADEVKCAHGATTGRLDPDMLFYLLSRGLARDTAQSLLVYAFLADVLTGMSLPAARTAIEDALIAQLPDSQLLEEFR